MERGRQTAAGLPATAPVKPPDRLLTAMASTDGWVTQSAEKSATMPVREDLDGPYKAYNLNMKVRACLITPFPQAKIGRESECYRR